MGVETVGMVKNCVIGDNGFRLPDDEIGGMEQNLVAERSQK